MLTKLEMACRPDANAPEFFKHICWEHYQFILVHLTSEPRHSCGMSFYVISFCAVYTVTSLSHNGPKEKKSIYYVCIDMPVYFPYIKRTKNHCTLTFSPVCMWPDCIAVMLLIYGHSATRGQRFFIWSQCPELLETSINTNHSLYLPAIFFNIFINSKCWTL